MVLVPDVPSGPAPAIRPAATLILLRPEAAGPSVLMGQRGDTAVFMPRKVVFPGGAVDADDVAASLATPLAPHTAARLAQDSDVAPGTIAAAAIRELWEETGLILGVPGTWRDVAPPNWQDFAATGHRPAGAALRFVFRAITPPANPRRFDARFLLATTAALASDPDDFSRAADELSGLQWVPLEAARTLDLPFITRVVLAEIAALGPDPGQPDTVPFFRNDDEANQVRRLGGADPLD